MAAPHAAPRAARGPAGAELGPRPASGQPPAALAAAPAPTTASPPGRGRSRPARPRPRQMAGRPEPGPRTPPLSSRRCRSPWRRPLSSGLARGAPRYLGRGSPSRRPPPPASGQACSLAGPAAAPLPLRLHFEKSRRYRPGPAPGRGCVWRNRVARDRLWRHRSIWGAEECCACAGPRAPVPWRPLGGAEVNITLLRELRYGRLVVWLLSRRCSAYSVLDRRTVAVGKITDTIQLPAHRPVPANPHSFVPHPHSSWTPPGMVTLGSPCHCIATLAEKNSSKSSTWTSCGAISGHYLSPYGCYLGEEADPHLTITFCQGVVKGNMISLRLFSRCNSSSSLSHSS